MVFSGISYQEPGVHDGHETFENVVGWGDPLFVNHFKGQALIGAGALDIGNPAIPTETFAPATVTIAAANLAVVTITGGHNLVVGDRFSWVVPTGMVELDSVISTVFGTVTATTFIMDTATTGFTAWSASAANFFTVLGASTILRAGLLMGHNNATSEWLPLSIGSSDGTEFVRGVLHETVQMNIPSGLARKRWRGHVMWGGPVRASRLIVPGETQLGLATSSNEAAIRLLMRDDFWMDDQFEQAID